MNIPTITPETRLPFEVWLTRPGGPLEGLKAGRVEQGRIRTRYYLGGWEEGGGFWVLTIGHTAQTQRRRRFGSRQAMTDYANAWLASTIERGLSRLEQQRVTIH